MENFIIAIVTFFFLTLLHPIGDFLTPYRQWDGEYWIVLNPLHALWDISPLRKHGRYAKDGDVISQFLANIERKQETQYRKTYENIGEPVMLRKYKNMLESKFIVGRSFWFWLGVDQIVHVILNLIFAVLVFYDLIFLFLLGVWAMMGAVYINRDPIRKFIIKYSPIKP